MNDLVEVGGHYYNTPTVHMISKVNGIVSLTGEKLYEPQFIQAVHEAEEETGLKTKFFVGFADVDESKYHFYFEFADKLVQKRKNREPDTEMVTQEEADAFAKVVDAHLQKINVEYESKRQSFRLHEPQAHILLSNAYSRFKAACLRDGFRDGQFKFNLLMQDEKRRSRFRLLERIEKGAQRLSDSILEGANQWDTRIDENRKRRSERRQARADRRAKRRGELPPSTENNNNNGE